MEVHAHTHSPRKKWTHYLWEFLMLFLAVFCGFLAENQREHMVEHQREKKYIQSLIADLQINISKADSYIQFREEKATKIDSLIHLLTSGQYQQEGAQTLYLFVRATKGFNFIPANGTLQQLKNAGNLRLIRKLAVVDSIIAYDVLITRQELQDEIEQGFIDRLREINGDYFNAASFYETYDLTTNKVLYPSGNPPLLTKDARAINSLTTHIIYARAAARYAANYAIELKQNAERLIGYLTNEYRL